MIKENIKKILNELPLGVELTAATKNRNAEEVRQAFDAGVKIVGENYVKEAEEKFSVLGSKLRWHLIGHLQKNKVKLAVKIFDVIETLDSFDLAVILDKECEKAGKIMSVLIEVNSAAESQKSGVLIENVEELLSKVIKLINLKPMGLMTMGPLLDDPELLRPFFRRTKDLFYKIKDGFGDKLDWVYLSMGMSSTYKVAIEEGANIVRVGTAIFGERTKRLK